MPSRRRFLVASATLAGTALAGCLDGGSSGPEYRLEARNLGGPLPDALLWSARGPFADADRALARRLAAAGSLTTTGYRIVLLGDEHPYLAVDGTYYRVGVERRDTVSRERWVLWFDLLPAGERPPTDASVVTTDEVSAGFEDRSEPDRLALEQAAGTVEGEFGPRDVADDPLGQRGYVFARRDADESDVVPDPPFDYLAIETSDGRRYARAVAERGAVDLRQFRYTAEEVATSREAYDEHVVADHLVTDFDANPPPDEAAEVVAAICGGVVYDERPPLPDGVDTVIDRLGLSDLTVPEGATSTHGEAAFRYDGTAFRGQVWVFR